MVTNFPAQIDSFAIHAPEEIISHLHVNNLQDAMVAVQVYTKSIEEALSNHVDQALSAHAATSISVNTISGLNTTNVQTAIADLKTQLDASIVFFSTTLDGYYTAHIAEDLDLAHPNGLFPGSRLTAASITGSKIALGTIDENHLSFFLATQAELDTHASANIATAHPNGLFPIARLDTDVATQVELDAHISANIATAHPNGTFPIARLDTDVATQVELNTHITTSTNVHGIGVGNSVVGTSTTQTLQNKKIISDFDGSKVLIFTTTVSDVEKTLYNSSSYSSRQLEVRQESLASIVSTDHLTGPTSTIQVADSSFFSNVEGILNGLEFVVPPANSGILATITNIPDSTTLVLDGYYPAISSSTHYALNKTNFNPLFYVDQDGKVLIRELHVESGLNNVTLNDDVTIQGTLTVTGATLLQDGLSIQGNLSSTGSFSALGISSNASLATISSSNLTATGSATILGSATVGNDLTVADQVNVGGSVHVFQNETVDGYLSVGQSLAVSGNANVSNYLITGGGIHTSGGISADGMITSQGGIFTDGYSIIGDDLVVQGDLIVTGVVTVGGILPADQVTFDGYTAPNLALVSPLLGGNLQEISVELQQNLEAHMFDAYGAHDGYAIALSLIANSASLDLQSFLEEFVGVGGLLEGSFDLLDNQSLVDVTGLSFDPLTIRSAHIEYSIYRNYTGPALELAAVGTLRIIYKNILDSWTLDDTYAGDNVGVNFNVTSLGQVQYTSTNIVGILTSFKMKYKARTTEQ